jgi:hypothetical protein
MALFFSKADDMSEVAFASEEGGNSQTLANNSYSKGDPHEAVINLI